jgi:predicted Zn-dependent peptidase
MNYTKKILPNGLSVITVPMPSFESATVMVMVGAGSRYETKTNNGISHFLEHMAFKGTEKRPTAMDIASLVDGIGGEFNAFTSKEITGYFVKSAKDELPTTVDLLSDMLQNSKFDPVEIDKERGVIIEELNLYEDQPHRDLPEVYERLVFGDSPLGWNTGGLKDNIRKISRQDFMDYLASLYSADNITVVMAGGINESETFKLAEEKFGNMKKFETIKPLANHEKQAEPRVSLKTKSTEQAHIAIGVRTVALNSPKRYPLTILSAILGGGMSSRLFNEVREKRGLAYYVRASSDQYTDVGTFVATSGVDPKRIEEAIEVIVDHFAKLGAGSLDLTEKELTKAKELLKGHFVLELEDSRAVAGHYAQQEILEDEIKNPEEEIKKIDDVNLEEVIEVGKEYFRNEGLNMAIIANFDNKDKFEKLLEI